MDALGYHDFDNDIPRSKGNDNDIIHKMITMIQMIIMKVMIRMMIRQGKRKELITLPN